MEKLSAATVRMVKSLWPGDIPNGTLGIVIGEINTWTSVQWATGHVVRMREHEIEKKVNG